MKLLIAAGILALLQLPLRAADSGVDHVGAAPTADAWVQRESTLVSVAKKARAGDPQAQKEFDKILTEYETRPLARTPIENMDILGLFYVPQEGAEKCMPVVVMNAALGWYDALRFGSESGREELMANRKLFLMAFLLDGTATSEKSMQYLKTERANVGSAVEQGLALAARWKDAPGYDHRWVTTFGLERVIALSGGSSNIVPLPKDQWDAAWESTKKRIYEFYDVPEKK